uniref:Zinc knuckle CX2CX4HX4C domain-containing protein n=1 Tax=Cannabis sativa TaxID=3483 RepID=A0A803QD77_CANSA
MIIRSIVVEVTAIFLGATGIFVGIIICSPDMEKLLLAEMLLPESFQVCSSHYISDYYLIYFATCLFLQYFFLYLCLNTGFSPFVGFLNLCPALIMDDLSNSFTATLNLTALETQIHSFSETPDHPEDDGREEPSAFSAVKLLTNRHFNPEAFKNRLKQMWPERFSINILEKEPNFFTVEFGCFGDRRRVLIGQPWHFDYKLIVMTPLEAGSVVTVESLTTTPFWIQVSGIPFLKRSRALAQRLGEVLGRFIEVDTTSLKETWGPYLRVRIEIDVTQPLPRGTGFQFQGMAAPVWLEFRFENLPDFCHYCGRLSHIVNHCHEFLAKCDSSSAPPLLHYDQSLGAKIRITSNPFYIACSRTRLRPHIANPTSLAPPPPYRLHQASIIPEGTFNDPTTAYGVQHFSQPQTTLMGLYNAQSSPHINLNHSPPNTTIWPYTQPVVATTTTTASHTSSPAISSNNLISPHSQPLPPITTAEQLAAPLPLASHFYETLVALLLAPQHVVSVSQDFSTILADLHPSQPLCFVVGSSANPAPSSSRVRKFKPQCPDCLNAAEF